MKVTSCQQYLTESTTSTNFRTRHPIGKTTHDDPQPPGRFQHIVAWPSGVNLAGFSIVISRKYKIFNYVPFAYHPIKSPIFLHPILRPVPKNKAIKYCKSIVYSLVTRRERDCFKSYPSL